jgi:hypothetical protein
MLVGSTPTAGQQHFTFPANLFKIADVMKFVARGIISCAATTPGTATYDLRFGSVIVFSTGAMNLNTTGKTNVPWTLEVDLSIRSIGAGTTAKLWGQGTFSSEALVGAAVNTAGGNSLLNVPVGSLALSPGFSTDTSFLIDSYFTQTVATGSMTAQIAYLEYKT